MHRAGLWPQSDMAAIRDMAALRDRVDPVFTGCKFKNKEEQSMRKTVKSIIAAGLAAVCVFGSACGRNADPKNEQPQGKDTAGTTADSGTNSGTTTSQGTEDGNAQTGADTTSYPDYLNLDGFRPIVKEGEKVTLSVMTMRDSIASSNMDTQWFKKFVEEKLNIKLDIEEVTASTYVERKNLMLASNDLKDIMLNLNFTANDLVTYGQDGGQFLPMSDYFSETLTPNILNSMEGKDIAVASNTAPDGKMYTVPVLLANYTGFGNTIGKQRIFIDQKYLEAAGVTEIPDTLDGFVDMLRKFKALDPASMGVDEIWPMVSTWGNDKQFLLNAFGWLENTDTTAPVLDVYRNDITIACADERFGEYITLLNTLYHEELIHPDFFTLDKTAARALYTEGSVPVIADSAPYISVPERFEDYISAFPLKSQYNEQGLCQSDASYMLGTMVISADTKYPEVCMRLLDYMYTEEGGAYAYQGCPENSGDTLGIISGYRMAADGAHFEFPDVQSGSYTSDYDYRVNAIQISQFPPRDENKYLLYAMKIGGVEEPQYPQLDLTNPDDHYRYICYEAQKGHLIDGLPQMYMNAEQAVRYGDLKTVIKNYVDAETAKFVVGQRDLNELPKYFEELKELGIDEYIQLCRDAYSDYIETLN